MTRHIGILIAAYELVALTSRRIPPLTDILRSHPLLSALAVAWIADHLVRPR